MPSPARRWPSLKRLKPAFPLEHGEGVTEGGDGLRNLFRAVGGGEHAAAARVQIDPGDQHGEAQLVQGFLVHRQKLLGGQGGGIEFRWPDLQPLRVGEQVEGRKLAVEERAVTESELLSASEIWLSSSTKEIMPVIELEGRPVGQGTIGPQCLAVTQRYIDYKQQQLNALDK